VDRGDHGGMEPTAAPPLLSTFLPSKEKDSAAGLRFYMVFCVLLSFLMFRLGRLLVLNFSLVARAIISPCVLH